MMVNFLAKLRNYVALEFSRYFALKATEYYESSSEIMATMPQDTLVYQSALLASWLADIYADVARALADGITD